MRNLQLDIRHAVRGLLRTPYVTSVAILSIGVGVGSATAVYSWMDGLVLHPFPAAADQGRLVGIEVGEPNGGMGAWSYRTFQELRAATGASFGDVAAWRIIRVSTREPGEQGSVSLLATPVSADYFRTLGVAPAIGRAIDSADVDAVRPVAVISHQYWLDRFNGDRGVVGRTLLLNGEGVTVVGVAPPRFSGVYTGVVPQFYVPITLQPRLAGTDALQDRKLRSWLLFARLAPGVPLEVAAAQADAAAKRITAAYGDRPAPGARVMPLRVEFLGATLSPLFVALLAVSAVLVALASANVAGLLLVRASARADETALRRALGASAGQVVRTGFIESAILALLGTAAGVLVTVFARGALYALIPRGAFPITLPIPISWRVLAGAAAVATVVTIACGVAPALAALRVTAMGALRAGARSRVGGRARLQGMIVGGQLALCVVALVLAGMFGQGLRAAAAVDIGFTDPQHVLLVDTDFGTARLTDTSGVAALGRLVGRLRALPGVSAASVASMVPLGFGGRRIVEVKVDGYAPGANDDLTAERAHVGADYAATMHIPVVAGRDIRDDDRAGAEPVALINEAFARRFLAGRDPLGARVDAGRGWARVVGVLHDGKYDRLVEAQHPVVYVPMAQWFVPAMTVHVRVTAATDPRSLADPVRAALLAINPDLPALQVRTLAEHVSASTFVPRTGSLVVGAVAAIAVLLSAVGLYGALAFAVVLRRREIALRRALGAGRGAVLRDVAARTATIVAGGLAGGVALAVPVGRALRGAVAGMGPGSAATWIGSVLVLAGVAAVAAWSPTLVALRVHPATALRGD